MSSMRIPVLLGCLLSLAACANTTPTATTDSEPEMGLLWVKHAAEYRALALQAYGAATRDLPRFVEDTTWSALPGQDDAAALPPAVIIDVDETVVSNVDFQLDFEPPFANWKLDKWNREHAAIPISGITDFVAAARAAGVTVYFVTNRPCEPADERPCSERQTTIDDIAEVGITTDAEFVLLSNERGWNREKSTRREHVARTHRVIMLIGDDLGDFIPCMRKKVYAPCTDSATAASREQAILKHRDRWGAGWYILPNPMHGSWTSAE